MTTEAIKAEGLDERTSTELSDMLTSHAAKILPIQKELNDLQRFPDARRKEIYEALVESGEVEAAPEDGSPLSAKVLAKVDAELQHEIDYYQRKLQKLTDVCSLIETEQVNRGNLLH